MEEVFKINPNNIESVLFGIIDRDEELLNIIYYHNEKQQPFILQAK